MHGKKNDQRKPPLALNPPHALEEMAKGFGYGAEKYGQYNFLGGIAVTRTLSAALRHINAFLKGEDNDIESGNSHLGHALASIAMTVENYKVHGKKVDDRFKYDADV